MLRLLDVNIPMILKSKSKDYVRSRISESS